jgi:hypothetical protein
MTKKLKAAAKAEQKSAQFSCLKNFTRCPKLLKWSAIEHEQKETEMRQVFLRVLFDQF